MPQKTENQEIDERFAAWKTQIESEISDSLHISDSAVYALRSPKDFQSAIALCRIALSYFDKAENLKSVLSNALVVRDLKDAQ